jgi:hypothetical protein
MAIYGVKENSRAFFFLIIILKSDMFVLHARQLIVPEAMLKLK